MSNRRFQGIYAGWRERTIKLNGMAIARVGSSMLEIAHQLAVLVTASENGDAIGQRLKRSGVSIVNSTGSLQQLRRSLLRGSFQMPVVLCVTLDSQTVSRHQSAVRGLLGDRNSFTTPLSAIGLSMDAELPHGWQELGCDAIANDVLDLYSMLQEFDRRWSHARASWLHARSGERAPAALTSRIADTRPLNL